jgi:phosphate:Na+ symporter
MAKTMLEAAGGLALFLFGIALMTGGLRDWTSERLPRLLRRATAGRGRGLVVGTMLGALVQRSAGTMLTVGFVHAGLMTLAQSLPLLLGLNIGTTLAIQLIAFRVTDYAGLPLAVGALLFLTGGGTRRRSLGVVLLGLGIIFFGLATAPPPAALPRGLSRRWRSRRSSKAAARSSASCLPWYPPA